MAAAYLARAGRRVQVLERLDHVGGAAVSAHAFDGVDARLSRYSYLVSLLPRRIVEDLGARVRLVRRRYSSYTPDPATGGRTGLLIGPPSTFGAIGAAADEAGFAEFYRRCRVLTSRLWPTLLRPLCTRDEARKHVGDDAAWRFMVDEPIGHAITDAVSNDLVRGVMATDALIGTFARADDPSLTQNMCFLYHLLGGGTGDWDVPVGGMGAVSGALAAAATGHGAEIITRCRGLRHRPRRGGALSPRRRRSTACTPDIVLANVTPAVLAALLGEPTPAQAPGAQVKVNLMLRRLPRLRDRPSHRSRRSAGRFTSTRPSANSTPPTRAPTTAWCPTRCRARSIAIR